MNKTIYEKAYIFKMNGHVIDLEDVNNCLQYESDWCNLFTQGSLEFEDCSSDNSNDIITVEEIDIQKQEKLLMLYKEADLTLHEAHCLLLDEEDSLEVFEKYVNIKKQIKEIKK